MNWNESRTKKARPAMQTELKPGDRVRLKPLEECEDGYYIIDKAMHGFWNLDFVTVKDVDHDSFSIVEDVNRDFGFEFDWIAEVIPAESPAEEVRIKPTPITPTPGPPELEGVPRLAWFLVKFEGRAFPESVRTWWFRNWAGVKIEWHVGPIMPPEVQE
jgi:hypothetical protein